MEIRSGRFKKKGEISEKLTVVVGKKGNAIYRFFNSGEVDFNVIGTGGGGTTVTLKPTLSVDVALDGELQIERTQNNDEVEGIYDIVSTDRQIRSGRFRIPGANPPSKQKVIILKKANVSYYRFYNSGDPVQNAVFEIQGLANVPKLEPGETIDIVVAKNQEVSIKGVNANVEVEGIYEFLGSE